MQLRYVKIRKLTTSDLFFSVPNFLALGFGSGLSPFAPGTMGTLVAIPLYLLCIQFDLLTYSAVVLISIGLGIYICGKTAEMIGEHDHPGIVWDEISGLLITFYLIPFSWMNLLIGFLFFRFFDIVKPWPIKWADAQVSGGTGIMLDDIIAGIFACLSLHCLNSFLF